MTLNSGYQPLVAYLPLSLAGRIDEIKREGYEKDQRAVLLGLEKNDSEFVGELVLQLELTRRVLLAFPPPRSSGEGLIKRNRSASNDPAGVSASAEPVSHLLAPHAFDHPAGYEVRWNPDQREEWASQS